MIIKFANRTERAVLIMLLSVFFCIALTLGVSAANEMPSLEGAASVYLYNLTQNKAIVEKEPSKVVYPASTVKIMTGLLAAESLSERLDEQITVTAEMLSNIRGNNIKLSEGEQVTVRDMIYGVLCGGNNDCAAVLAHIVAGGTSEFVAMMNQRAAQLGTKTTNFTNVSGMHSDNMVTTASDTLLIASAAYSHPLIMEAVTKNKYEMPATNKSAGRNIYNKNYLISRYISTSYYNSLAKGMNAGYTAQGGHCLVTSAQRNGQEYICVIMGGEEINGRIRSYDIASELFNWVFDAYGEVKVLDVDSYLGEIRVTLAQDTDHVTVKPQSSLTVFLPSDINVETDIELIPKLNASELEAPITEGQAVGTITVKYNGEILGSVDLVTTDKVERSEFLYALRHLKEFTSKRWFIASVIALVVLSTAYVLVVASIRGKTNRRRRRRR